MNATKRIEEMNVYEILELVHKLNEKELEEQIKKIEKIREENRALLKSLTRLDDESIERMKKRGDKYMKLLRQKMTVF